MSDWQPHQAQPAYPPGGYAQDHPKATTAMVLGILGLLLCSLVAPFAWAIGKQTMVEIDASQGRLSGRGMAQAGYIMGIIGTLLLGVGLLLILGVVLLAVVTSGAMFSG